jgi:multidrug efflux pump subunit AcrA (membrane-fusion protein)
MTRNKKIFPEKIFLIGILILLFISCGKNENTRITSPRTKENQGIFENIIGRVKIEDSQIKLAGIKTAPVKELHLFKEIHAVGKVAFDPTLAVAEEEFLSALYTLDKVQTGTIPEIKKRALNLIQSSKRKLMLLGLSETQINELEKIRQPHENYILPQEKMWIYGDVYEYELNWVKIGEKVIITSPAIPGEELEGIISSINPVVNPKTRAVTFRAEIVNPDLKLKPRMYVAINVISTYIGPQGKHLVLAVPKDAVMDTGTRKIVWIDKGKGEYEGREIHIGPEAMSFVNDKKVKFYPVLRGLREGELVVTKSNFLIDSQSQITGAAAGAYGGALDKKEKKAPHLHHH